MVSHELGLNGDPATPEDIAALETWAIGTLESVPTECWRQQVFNTAEGSYLLIATRSFEEKADEAAEPITEAFISVGNYDASSSANIKYFVTFDYDNQATKSSATPEDPDEAIRIAQDLLTDSQLQLHPTERELLKQVKDWATFSACGLEFKRMHIFTSDVASPQFDYTGDVIRSRVLAGSDAKCKTKNQSLDVGDNELMIVESNEFVGDVDLNNEECDAYPKLQIIYKDSTRQFFYLYTRTQLDEVTLKTIPDLGQPADEEPVAETEEVMEELLDELDDFSPSKIDVQFLIDKIIEASLVEAG